MTTTALVKPRLRTIRLYGTLAKIIGCRKLRAVVSSVSEAMRFLLANFPQIEGYLKGRFFKVKVANRALSEDDLKLPIGQAEEIHIIPAISGAGGNGDGSGNSGFQILTGIALIGIGLLVPFTAPFLVPLGIGLTLTGVANLLTPTLPDREESTDAAQSYNFSGVQQTSREGPPVPLVYGEIITGSVVLSVNIERDDEELSAEFDAGQGGFLSQVVGGLYNSQYPGICWYYYIEVYLEQDPDCAPNQPPKVFTNIANYSAHRPFSTATLPYNPQYLDPDNCFNLVTRGGSARFTVLDAGGCQAPFAGPTQDNTEYSVGAAFDNTGGLQPIGMRIWHEYHSGPSYSNVPRTLVYEHSRFGDPLPDALRP
jgi:predicted phage tail protein